ncbi:MAG: PD-(D/E)XK nuclease family protein [Nitrospira sp.]|nr:PD-(D/E)XK nuclease family protein [Nitrospira sp.]
MRNVFDQYTQPENRLTHALVSALSEDRRLLRLFVRWATRQRIGRTVPLEIIEQSLPGERVAAETDAEKRGLPDACIYRNNDWVLLIESKVASPLRTEQLQRHFRTASRRGFQIITLLVIDVDGTDLALPDGTILRKWSEIYAWLIAQSSRSDWAKRAADYFVIAENRLVEEGYLKEGTLTTFSGIPFRKGEPYNYPEAKRLIRLAMDELRKNRALICELGMNPRGTGRGSITGQDGVSVWDFLRLKNSKQNKPFTNYPHLTLSIETDRILAIVTVPHGIETEMRRNLLELEYDGFQDLLANVNLRLLRALRKAPGASPWVIVVQRRYPTQRAQAILDARIEYDLRTASPEKQKGSKVRPQPQWLKATYDALCKKRSNLQVAVGAIFPYTTCPATKNQKIVDHVANIWLACKPLLDVMLHGRR